MATILVVDDKAANRDLLAYLLRSSGHVVEQAASGQAALAAVAVAVPDLVIMDISMPGVDGFTAARRLRTDARLDDVPLVAVSATSYADVSSARAAGFDAFYSLPIDPMAFVQEVEAHLAHHVGGSA